MRALTLRRALVAPVVVATLAASYDARAATFIVNTTDTVVSGVCATSPGGCTLPDAITAANSTPGRDTIAFDPAVFPPGSATVIPVTGLPIAADPAGTVIDGAGASVVIEGGPLAGIVLPPGSGRGAPVPVDGLVIASGSGVPLSKPTVANLTVHGFSGRGIFICGGNGTICDQDVAGAVVQNVVVAGNGITGIDIDGASVTKTRVVETVATSNADSGIRIAAAAAVVDARIQGATARDNNRFGVSIVAPAVAGTLVTDTVAAHNTSDGVQVNGTQSITKTKIMRVAVSRNGGHGIDVFGAGSATATTLASITAAGNTQFGIDMSLSDVLSGAVIKDVVANQNRAGIALGAITLVTGVKITNAKAAGNSDDGISFGSDQDVRGCTVSGAVLAANGKNGLSLQGSSNVATQVRAGGNQFNGIELRGPGSGNTISKSSLNANDGNGIVIDAGNTGNSVQKNISFAHDGADLRDENPGCAGNVWKQNTFESRNDPCID